LNEPRFFSIIHCRRDKKVAGEQ